MSSATEIARLLMVITHCIEQTHQSDRPPTTSPRSPSVHFCDNHSLHTVPSLHDRASTLQQNHSADPPTFLVSGLIPGLDHIHSSWDPRQAPLGDRRWVDQSHSNHDSVRDCVNNGSAARIPCQCSSLDQQKKQLKHRALDLDAVPEWNGGPAMIAPCSDKPHSINDRVEASSPHEIELPKK